MSRNEFNHLLNSIATLSPEQMQRLYRELESKMAATNVSRPTADPLLGSMKDHAELMDQIVEDAMRHREQQPWRLSTDENKALLDTDTLSEIGKGKHPAITAKAKTYRKACGYYSFSVITVLEIIRGYQKAQHIQRMHAFLYPGTKETHCRSGFPA
jgi:hypothetical protein